MQRLGEDALANVLPWELILMDDESASEMLGFRVWLGGEWDLCERYRFMAVVCVRMLNNIRAQKELRKFLEQGDAACDLDEDDVVEGIRRDVLYPEEVIDAKLGGYWDARLGLNLPWKDYFKRSGTFANYVRKRKNSSLFLNEQSLSRWERLVRRSWKIV